MPTHIFMIRITIQILKEAIFAILVQKSSMVLFLAMLENKYRQRNSSVACIIVHIRIIEHFKSGNYIFLLSLRVQHFVRIKGFYPLHICIP